MTNFLSSCARREMQQMQQMPQEQQSRGHGTERASASRHEAAERK
jgi:hypothetical protein